MNKKIELFKSENRKSILTVHPNLKRWQEKEREKKYKGTLEFVVIEMQKEKPSYNNFFLSKSDAKVLFHQLMNNLITNEKRYYSGNYNGEQVTSKALKVSPTEAKKYKVSIMSGQGHITFSGVIAMKKKEEETTHYLNEDEVLKMAIECLDFIKTVELEAVMNDKPLVTEINEMVDSKQKEKNLDEEKSKELLDKKVFATDELTTIESYKEEEYERVSNEIKFKELTGDNALIDVITLDNVPIINVYGDKETNSITLTDSRTRENIWESNIEKVLDVLDVISSEDFYINDHYEIVIEDEESKKTLVFEKEKENLFSIQRKETLIIDKEAMAKKDTKNYMAESNKMKEVSENIIKYFERENVKHSFGDKEVDKMFEEFDAFIKSQKTIDTATVEEKKSKKRTGSVYDVETVKNEEAESTKPNVVKMRENEETNMKRTNKQLFENIETLKVTLQTFLIDSRTNQLTREELNQLTDNIQELMEIKEALETINRYN